MAQTVAVWWGQTASTKNVGINWGAKWILLKQRVINVSSQTLMNHVVYIPLLKQVLYWAAFCGSLIIQWFLQHTGEDSTVKSIVHLAWTEQCDLKCAQTWRDDVSVNGFFNLGCKHPPHGLCNVHFLFCPTYCAGMSVPRRFWSLPRHMGRRRTLGDLFSTGFGQGGAHAFSSPHF